MPRKKKEEDTPFDEFTKSIQKLPLSYQRRIVAPLEKIVKQDEAKQAHEYLESISNGPRLVTHIDEDGLVSAIMMVAANPKKYAEIVYTDYRPLNAGSFTFLLTDDVVDLPQPRNPILDEKGEPVKNKDGVVFEEVVTNFWADHHETGKRGEYAGEHLYDPKSRSCSSLLYKHFMKKEPSFKRFKELVEGTDIVDSASYRTAEAPYDMGNPGVLLRLFLTNAKGQKGTSPGFREKLIREAADEDNDWKEAVYSPVVKAIAQDALAQFEIYRQYIKPFITSEHGVTIKMEEKVRARGLGIKDRYYAHTAYPENMFVLDVWSNIGGRTYSIAMSENMLHKDKEGNHPSKLILGEELGAIVEKVIGDTNAGGHKGIGVCTTIPASKKDEVVKACKELLYEETKRLGAY
jgi:hypothetical protein